MVTRFLLSVGCNNDLETISQSATKRKKSIASFLGLKVWLQRAALVQAGNSLNTGHIMALFYGTRNGTASAKGSSCLTKVVSKSRACAKRYGGNRLGQPLIAKMPVTMIRSPCS